MAHDGGSDSDEEYIYVGTKLEDAFETRGYRNPSANKDPGSVRSLPVWKQEVTDEQGRKRFHGAFTGGFSAGYFNTVGSKVRICAPRCVGRLCGHITPKI